MLDSVETVGRADRHRIAPLFAGHSHLRAGVDSILQGNCGVAVANQGSEAVAAQLAIGPITFFGGDAHHPAASRLVTSLSGLRLIIVPDKAWRDLVYREHGEKVKTETRLPFSSEALSIAHLRKCAKRVARGYRIARMDLALARRVNQEVNPDLILPEVFASPTDFVERGVGFCALRGHRLVCGATSALLSDKAIEIQINTIRDHRGQGLATAVGAALAAHCLERGVDPGWDTGSAASERVALKLGYVPRKRYDWLILPG
jgi:hypothetical protein